MATITIREDNGNTTEHLGVPPLMTQVTHLVLEGHEDVADALLKVDWLVSEYLLTEEPLDPDAQNMADRLREIVQSWTPKN